MLSCWKKSYFRILSSTSIFVYCVIWNNLLKKQNYNQNLIIQNAPEVTLVNYFEGT